MSTETPWVFDGNVLKVGAKIRQINGTCECEIRKFANAKVVIGIGLYNEYVTYPDLYRKWEPVPPAPVYLRPDLSDWWCVMNFSSHAEAIFGDQSSAENYARGIEGWNVIPYSDTTPAKEPEPMVPVAKVREWIAAFRRMDWFDGAYHLERFLREETKS